MDLAAREIPRPDYDRLTDFPVVYVPSTVGVVDREEYRTPARILSLIAGGRAQEVLQNPLFDLETNGRLHEVGDAIAEYFSGSIDAVSFDLASDEFIHVYDREDAEHDLFSAGAGFLQVRQLVVSRSIEATLADDRRAGGTDRGAGGSVRARVADSPPDALLGFLDGL